LPPWLSPVERLAVNQSVKGSNPFGGAIFSQSEAETTLSFTNEKTTQQTPTHPS
jgi:hypothetical protein